MNSAGLVYGTITTTDTYTFTVTVSNTAGEDTREFTLSVKAAVVAPKITTAQDLGTYVHGGSFDKKIEATGTTPITWSETGLPSWLTLNSETGEITGKAPDKTGETSFTVTATNAGGKDSRKFTLNVKAVPIPTSAPTISTDKLPDGKEGVAYNVTLEAGGTSPITWSATGLPDGLTLTAAGKLTGSPKANGTFTVIVTAANSVGSDVKTFTYSLKKTTVGFEASPTEDHDHRAPERD